jgi:hypothetical protein
MYSPYPAQVVTNIVWHNYIQTVILDNEILIWKYSQTCIKRSPLRPRKSGFVRQVTS